ncbi:hypothetical protein NEHOM01_0807 [Nematocida homosporus]|uniref:uncharacterized protein n=1 Tax=Nematocida homosporus TaxID=1912981 RepID=UPI00221E8933|nr:uncharacterized protein NEHOM01_0807 [Nematocida homosporus]KAI5185392.1 hypothetical protein NEHOM01_0807 [Nematocida homosporus]
MSGHFKDNINQESTHAMVPAHGNTLGSLEPKGSYASDNDYSNDTRLLLNMDSKSETSDTPTFIQVGSVLASIFSTICTIMFLGMCIFFIYSYSTTPGHPNLSRCIFLVFSAFLTYILLRCNRSTSRFTLNATFLEKVAAFILEFTLAVVLSFLAYSLQIPAPTDTTPIHPTTQIIAITIFTIFFLTTLIHSSINFYNIRKAKASIKPLLILLSLFFLLSIVFVFIIFWDFTTPNAINNFCNSINF